ncbi:M20/M25/M40 family metallo-hydrolase [Pseudonocardia acaciae]|uniref:M20/M25/M40 family metallo-hydrolase n=1 Tax=Pseudonocardia acaciae TaxID=551276 RepID=UPI00048FD57D|nr:M20/M25/M40 family metallo-hydrolase [Pseudonocardia acaciae]
MDAELRRLLTSLVAIDSVNPGLDPGGAGEREIGELVAGWLRERGFDVTGQAVRGCGGSNVIGRLPGAGGGRSLMLNGHLDTVGVAGMREPHRPRVEHGRLYGRGALDMKGGLAALLHAAARARAHQPRGDVVVAAVVDEEFLSAGTEALLSEWRTDGAIIAEPTNLDVVTCHKGFAWLEVTVTGVAAHGSRPEEGVDAIAKAGHVLVGVERLAERFARGAGHPVLGPGSVHASLIRGGQELSSYPASCTIEIERRTVPGENAATALAEMREILDAARARDSSFHATVRVTFERRPLVGDAGSGIATALREARRAENGATSGFSGWTDAALLEAAGIPTVVFGPRGEGLHAVEEWVELESVQECSDILLETILRFCGGAELGRR